LNHGASWVILSELTKLLARKVCHRRVRW